MVLVLNLQSRYVAPLLQTGNYHSLANPRTYMYLFSHISKSGDYPNVSRRCVLKEKYIKEALIQMSLQLSQSIAGEELPYVFGAPLAFVRPFPTSYTPQERLLSEEIMVYWTNFAKTGCV